MMFNVNNKDVTTNNNVKDTFGVHNNRLSQKQNLLNRKESTRLINNDVFDNKKKSSVNKRSHLNFNQLEENRDITDVLSDKTFIGGTKTERRISQVDIFNEKNKKHSTAFSRRRNVSGVDPFNLKQNINSNRNYHSYFSFRRSHLLYDIVQKLFFVLLDTNYFCSLGCTVVFIVHLFVPFVLPELFVLYAIASVSVSILNGVSKAIKQCLV